MRGFPPHAERTLAGCQESANPDEGLPPVSFPRSLAPRVPNERPPLFLSPRVANEHPPLFLSPRAP